MAATFELVIINSTDRTFTVSSESLTAGISDIAERSKTTMPKGVQRYKIKAGLYNTIDGMIKFCERGDMRDLTEFTVKFHHADGKWSFTVVPTRPREFHRLFTLNATEFIGRDLLSLGVAVDYQDTYG